MTEPWNQPPRYGPPSQPNGQQYGPPPQYGPPQYGPPQQWSGQPYPQQAPPQQQWFLQQPQHQWPPRFQVRLTEHTGALILWSQRRYTVVGTLEECEAAYRRAQNHCLAVGWWSIASVILFNWIAIAGNRSAIRGARQQAAALGWAPQQH
ncbi:hypothetical protein [Williamsia deligens]|uniref:Transmembrane protein n=1 Tax=Williamsia deligens TaxID=321325 RepID=A0ABW3GB76_9NOCA|nr:hypothetical protein [Williamsia deligens]